ncbi:MAG: DegT/DnrJ/EryC1/StrS family aminotransferase [Candidatus Saccharimonadaceae bacterium]
MNEGVSEPIYVTRSFLPPIEEYETYIQSIWKSGYLTNNGPLVREFQDKISKYLGVNNFQFVSNGTVALQLALSALDIKSGEIITTPFSYVATTSAILWERCIPIFVDIDQKTFCIDATKIEAAITPQTKAILAVHVFGNPCDVETIEAIAVKHGIKVIYDAAHAFGVRYKEKSLLDYGDVSTCSFHATKLFHTIEGGGVVSKQKDTDEKVDLAKRFGHDADDHMQLGINGKSSEFQAAMGLTNLKYIDSIISSRKHAVDRYNLYLKDKFQLLELRNDTEYNYAYYPVVFESEEKLLLMMSKLNAQNIFPRRYFYPSLNTLPYIKNANTCPVSEDISKRIFCLPLYADLEDSTVDRICGVMTS